MMNDKVDEYRTLLIDAADEGVRLSVRSHDEGRACIFVGIVIRVTSDSVVMRTSSKKEGVFPLDAITSIRKAPGQPENVSIKAEVGDG